MAERDDDEPERDEDDSNWDEEDDEDDFDYDAQDARIAGILGEDDELPVEECLDRFCAHLAKNLQLPCEVRGSEDFQWEEYYVLGPGDPAEYDRLCRTQPSYQDVYDLLSIDRYADSEWVLFPDDLGARVRRKSDGKKFILGLAELEAIDDSSPNHQLLHDYAVFFVNNR